MTTQPREHCSASALSNTKFLLDCKIQPRLQYQLAENRWQCREPGSLESSLIESLSNSESFHLASSPAYSHLCSPARSAAGRAVGS